MRIEDLGHWFGISPTERRGSFVLVLILFAVGAIYLFVDEYYHPVVELSEQDIAFIDSLLVRHETNEIDVKKESQSHSQKSKPTLNPKYYDPNTVSHDELVEMGVPVRTATIWANYREKGGRFKKPTDIQNIYTLDKHTYKTLLPFTSIAVPKRKPFNPKPIIQVIKNTSQKELFSFDPNTISNDSLKLLNIPPRLASSIVGYRKAGGTFRTVEKLKTSPGITDSIYRAIAPYVKIDSSYQLKKKSWKPKVYASENSLMEPINLNTADSSELVKIKGIGPVRAKVLIERRENIGGYHHIYQLYDGLYSIDTSVVEQISKYLYVDDSYQRIELQATDKWALNRNYYFNTNMATTAVNYFKHRDQKNDLDDFIANSPLSQEKWEKVKPYLTLHE